MYNSFFDLREKPFKLVPNPEFLFLGKCHEEALAHLTYATSQGDGFVEITGEVGTGKTTLCRVFLEDLDKDVEAAFIFNSKLDSTQLLKSIHKELGIISIANGPVELTADLNDFLLEKKSQGKSVILLIDEAQNLGKETLEQLRLLSNLETTRSKLLQIILVGQPELREILDSHEMRQLRQRINLSCHIHPMTQKETFDYITHRVNVASRKSQTLFTRPAQKAIYRFTRGIPRLINIACDRSLLVAYSLNRKKVTPSSVKIAVDELGMHTKPQSWFDSIWKKTAIAVFSIVFMLCLLYVAVIGIPPEWRNTINMAIYAAKPLNEIKIPIEPANPITPLVETEPESIPLPLLVETEPESTMAPSLIETEPESIASSSLIETELKPPDPVKDSVLLIEKTDVQKILSDMKNTGTRESAFLLIASLWNHEAMVQLNPLTQQIDSIVHFFKIAAAQNNFKMLYLEKNLGLIEKFNLPVIFEFELPDDPVKGFLGIVGITPDNEYMICPGTGEKPYKINPDELLPYLGEDMYIVWKDNFGYDKVVKDTSSKDSILSLKLLLSEIGFPLIDMSPIYDSPLKQAINQIQKKYGLVEDGLVGPLTKIVLLNEKKVAGVPYLNTARFELKQ